MAVDHVFAGPGKVFVRETRSPKGKVKQQLIWGDWVRVLSRDFESEGWLQVVGRGEKGWLPTSQAQAERLLEVNFVDVGQGDGAMLVTPDDRFLLIDAGVGDNLRRFLSWRFNLKLDHQAEEGEPHEVARTITFDFAVVSHPDLDHYAGFQEIFGSSRFRFRTIYHNTLVERPASTETLKLGTRATIAGRTCVTELIESQAQLEDLLDALGSGVATKYVKLLRTALASGRTGRIAGVTHENGYLDGYGPGHRTRNGKALSFEILGPVPIRDGGDRGLPWFSNPGKTKNGHSVVLRLRYGDVRFLLGGDLNQRAEEHLLQRHVGELPPAAADAAEQRIYLENARAVFGADVAKACHHGAADFTTTFLQAVDAAATVISSGDEESHCHPRPDTLGAVGRHGRGDRPLIFSTELARSTREYTRPSQVTQAQIRAAVARLGEATTAAARKKIEREIDTLLDKRERNVAVYGLITVRTDGERVLVAQKLERPRSVTGEEFDLQWLAPDQEGRLVSARDGE